MGIDKFGRYTRKEKALTGPKGEGFNLTPEGNYDIQGRRLQNVWEPKDDHDAVNFKTHLDAFRNCISRQNGEFDAQNSRLCNIADPIDIKDAVTKKYMQLHTPVKFYDKTAYSIHQYRLQDVAAPKSDSDAVNLLYFKTNTLQRNAKGELDANNSTIKNLPAPIAGGDAVNKAYVDQKAPKSDEKSWGFNYKRLTEVLGPVSLDDVVTLDYLQKHALCLGAGDQVPGKPTVGKSGNDWNAQDRRIKRLKKPHGLFDAVNKIFLKEALADLAFSIYKIIKRSQRSPVPDEKEWKAQALLDTTTWEELFDVILPPDDKPSQ